MPDCQRFIIDLDEESDQESDDEQVGADDEIGRLRRLLAASEAEKEEKERLLAASEAEKADKEQLLAEERAEKEQLEQEKAQLEEQLSACTDTNGARGRGQFPTFDPRQASNID